MIIITYIYILLECVFFIYYIYEYIYNILPTSIKEFTLEEKKNIFERIKTLNKNELSYIINGCIRYNKNTCDYYNNSVEISDLSNIEIKKLLKYSLLNTKKINKDEILINEIKNYIEKECEIKFKNNNSDRFIFSKWGENFIYFHYRPIILNILIKIIINIYHYYMIFLLKYEFYNCKKSKISFLYKNNNKKENMLFIHGFGIGYIPYINKLKYLEKKYNIIIFIMPNISGYYYGCVPTKDIIINAVDEFMELKNIKKYNILAHSFGTYVSQLILNNDIHDRINKAIYVDPIIFWMSSFKICDFNKKEKYLKNKTLKNYIFGIVIFFIVNLDIFINQICFRLMHSFDFLIIEPNDNILYVISKNDYLLDINTLYCKYKKYKNIIFIENAEHGDIFLC